MDGLIEFLCRRYAVGPTYAQAYVDYWNANGHTRLASEQDVHSLRDPEAMWFEFALSANWRGRELAKAIGAGNALRDGARYLDIGCGFGGMLVAFAEKGYDVQGIELDHIRVGLARSNLSDVAAASVVETGSILDPSYIAAQRPFDVITCIDVIEHVADVDTALENAVSLLRPGGLFYLEIPNKDAMDFILSDGHFSLFGITQLPRWAAIEYQQAHFAYAYDVGDFYTLSYYTAALQKLEMLVQAYPSPLHETPTWAASEAKACALLERLAGDLPELERAPASVRPYLKGNLDAYRTELAEGLARARTDVACREEFMVRFAANFWLVAAHKPTAH